MSAGDVWYDRSMVAEQSEVQQDVLALVEDLVPVVLPGTTVDPVERVVVLPVEGGRARVSTESLIDSCVGQPRHLWPRLVDQWLRAVRGRVDDLAAEEPAPFDPSQLRARLVPRADDDMGLVRLPYSDDLDVELALDLPDRVERVSKERLAASGLDLDTVVAAAIRQTVHNVLMRLEPRAHPLPEGTTVLLAATDGIPFVSAGLISVPQILGGDPPEHGVLVAAPTLTSVLMHRVESDRALRVAPTMAALVERMHDDADDPCSPRLYWWHEGDLLRLSVQEGPDGIADVVVEPRLERIIAALPASS